jgi:hypothetical protein
MICNDSGTQLALAQLNPVAAQVGLGEPHLARVRLLLAIAGRD